jgi:adenine-specific DNA methylase
MLTWASHERQQLLGAESRPRFEAARQKQALFDRPEELRGALLDFIADFANWDNSTVAEYLGTSRALTHAAHVALGGPPGSRPLVVDPFAGGGSIPLEALRVGADAFASDLNPVAVLLNRVLLEYIPKYGRRLADEVRKWGEWIKREAEQELAPFYPRDADGATPIAYLWARTIQCEGPGCGAEVPLVRSLWLAKKANRSVALQFAVNPKAKDVNFQIIVKQRGGWTDYVNPKTKIGDPQFEGTVKRGSATCPCCGYTTPATQVRGQLKVRRGGTKDSRLICVVTTHDDRSGRFYRLPTKADYAALAKAQSELKRREAATTDPLARVPNEPTPEGKGKGAGRAFGQRNYGMVTFADIYTDRQALTLTTLARIIREATSQMPQPVRILSAFALGRVNDLSMSLCRWLTSLEAIAAANGGQNRMPVVLDYVESNPFGGSGGDWLGQVDWIARVVEHLQASALQPGNVARSPAQAPSLPEDSADALVTDPPYYDAFPYSDLSDFFFIWLKRALGTEALDYTGSLVPKDDEVVVYDVPHGGPGVKDRKFFQHEMTRAFTSWRVVTKPSAIGVVVFANKTTEGWESLIQSIIDAGWIATASWPIDTERPNRQRALDSAALGSSVHVVCRPREYADGSVGTNDIGDWRDVLQELPRRIHEWMPRLAEEGIVGADAIFACLGPALEIFSRHSRVEKASGDVVTLGEYLVEVWAAVSREALSMIFEGADASGFEEDARLTAMWLWTLQAANEATSDGVSEDKGDESDDEGGSEASPLSGYRLEYDAARKIAQGLGAHMENLEHLVEVKGDAATLLSATARTNYLFGKDGATASRGREKKRAQMMLLLGEELETPDAQGGVERLDLASRPGATMLDRLHQTMILFGSGRGEAVRRFLVEEGVGRNPLFWRLAQALSALYPAGSDEKRWVDGVLARKKGLQL